MALGGGIIRHVLVDQVPAAPTSPAYVTFALGFGILGYALAYGEGPLFRRTLFQLAGSCSLTIYAIVGAQKGVAVGLPALGVLALAVVAPPPSRWCVDVTSGVPPKQSINGEWL